MIRFAENSSLCAWQSSCAVYGRSLCSSWKKFFMTLAVPISDCYERPLSGIEYRDVNFRCGLFSEG